MNTYHLLIYALIPIKCWPFVGLMIDKACTRLCSPYFLSRGMLLKGTINATKVSLIDVFRLADLKRERLKVILVTCI